MNKNIKIIEEFENKILNIKKGDITISDIDSFLSNKLSPQMIIIIYYSLKEKTVNPETLFNRIINVAKKYVTSSNNLDMNKIEIDYLIIIAFCLRFGADPNMYIFMNGIGNIHVLGFIYESLKNISKPKQQQKIIPFEKDNSNNNDKKITNNILFLNLLITMFLLDGSITTYPAFKKKNKGPENPKEESIIDWIQTHYEWIYPSTKYKSIEEFKSLTNKTNLIIISILMNDPTIFRVDTYTISEFEFSIRCLSYKIINEFVPNKLEDIMDDKLITLSIDYFNPESFSYLLKKGNELSYMRTMYLLYKIKYYKDLNYLFSYELLKNLFLMAVSSGVEIDKDQSNQISIIGEDFYNSFIEEYKKPYWQKVCTNVNENVKSSKKLKDLAISLNIDPTMDKKQICMKIEDLSKSDKELLKETAKKRQQIKISVDVSTPSEFITNNGEFQVPVFQCKNHYGKDKNPLNYNDLELVYYRDSDNNLWCFTSDSFSLLLESKTNPFNRKPLPSSFIEKIKYKISLLKKLGINVDEGAIATTDINPSFIDSIDKIDDEDVITEKYSKRYINNFQNIAISNGISKETIDNITKQQVISLFKNIDIDLSFLNDESISTTNAYIVMASIIDELNEINPPKVKLFFRNLGMLINKVKI